MNASVRFEAEADAEYRAAGRWYEERRLGLGLEFFDAVDAALRQIVRLPKAGAPVKTLPSDLPVRRAPVKRFPYHKIEHEGWLTATWQISDTGRRARFYTLSRAGRHALDREMADWERLSGAISRVVKLRDL